MSRCFFILILLGLVNLSFAGGDYYKSKEECEARSGKICDFMMCDSAPEGKTVEEVCGKNSNGWQPVGPEITKEYCERTGGYWTVLGLFPQQQCNFKASDVGKDCQDNGDCEGECIASLTPEQEKALNSGKSISTSGHCSEFIVTKGCLPFVKHGVVDNIYCLD